MAVYPEIKQKFFGGLFEISRRNAIRRGKIEFDGIDLVLAAIDLGAHRPPVHVR
jgi:hypothetical protein